MWSSDRRLRYLSTATAVLALLVALAAAGGIWWPSVYARETASWAAQGLGQDWIDLVVVAPLLAVCAVGVRRSALQLVLGGALVYLVYSFVLYAFAMHFNALFLVYCAVLGLAFYTLVGLILHLAHARSASTARPLRFSRAGGWFLIITAVAFYGLWLSNVIPALIAGEPPPDLAEVGLITNPVHVLDLALVLPAMLIAGVLLKRPASVASVVGPIAMTFNALMSLALVGMMVAMSVRGVPASIGVAVVTGTLSAISTAFLVLYLRQLAPARALIAAEPRSWLDEAHHA